MKSLKEYINESMFDEEDIETNAADAEITDWIIENYERVNPSFIKISKKPNKDGKYVVDYNADIQLNRKSSVASLTNGMFVWGEVKGDFICSYCTSLTSLAGSPEKVGRDFDCGYCYSLASLAGAPKKVRGCFICGHCNALTSLAGAPKEVGGGFCCGYCIRLTSLDGISKKIGGKINYKGCAKNFTKKDIEKAQNS